MQIFMGACTHTTVIANKNWSNNITAFFINGQNKPSQAAFVPSVKYQIIHESGQI